jgi:hypothetical protein
MLWKEISQIKKKEVTFDFQVSLTRKNMNVKLPHYKIYNNSQHPAGIPMVVLKVRKQD